MSKENKLQKAIKLEDKKNNKSKSNKVSDIMIGVLQLFIVASIGYSTAVILMGTTGYIPMILIAPQAVYAVVVLIKRFTK
jgi:uncharacterized membrane protein